MPTRSKFSKFVKPSGAKYISIKLRFRVIVGVIVAVVFLGGYSLFSQIQVIKTEIANFLLISKQAHLVHQLPHAVSMLASPTHDQKSLDHLKEQILHNDYLLDTFEPSDQALVSLVFEAFKNPGFNRTILGKNIGLYDNAHERFDNLAETTQRNIQLNLQHVEFEVLSISLFIVLLVSGIPIYFVGRLSNRLSGLKDKVDAFQTNHDPTTIELGRTDEIGDVGLALDQMYSIIETRRIEQMIKVQLVVEQEKMSAIANLAGGIAHEVGNPLASMMAEVQLLETACEKILGDSSTSFGSEASIKSADIFESINTSMSRLKNLLMQVSDFPVYDDEDVESVNLSELITSICRMISLDERTRQIEFSLNLSPTLPYLNLSHRRFSLALFLIMNSLIETLYDQRGKVAFYSELDELESRIMISIIGGADESHDFSKIVEKFSAEEDASNLIMARRLCSDYGGNVEIKIDPKKATYGFVIGMPLKFEQPVADVPKNVTKMGSSEVIV